MSNIFIESKKNSKKNSCPKHDESKRNDNKENEHIAKIKNSKKILLDRKNQPTKCAIIKGKRKPLNEIKNSKNIATPNPGPQRERKQRTNPSLSPIIEEDVNNMEYVTLLRDYDALKVDDLSLNFYSDESFLFDDEDSFKNVHTPLNFYELQPQVKPIKAVRKQSKTDDPHNKSMWMCLVDDECTEQDTKNEESGQETLGVVNLDRRETFVPHGVLYSVQYLSSIIEYQMHKEKVFKITDKFLKRFPITVLNRAIVINWLIKLQAYMRTEHAVTYAAVKIMDKTLDVLNIKLQELQLVALASFWLSLKFHSSNYEDAAWMVQQSDGAYTVQQLIDMERKVLKANDFHVYSLNFSTYAYYYILQLRPQNADLIAHCVHYMLDCAILDHCFARTLPSLLVLGAIFTTLRLLKQYDHGQWISLSIYKQFPRPQELLLIKNNLIMSLREMNDPTCPCREPLKKFSSKRYMNVANIINDALKVYKSI